MNDERIRRDLEGDYSHEGEALTPREDQVMSMSEQGETDRGISRLLRIGHSTLHHHLSNAYAKLAPGRGRSGAFFEFGRRKRNGKP